tara:strand:+ start:54 stop:404 length:351 start_codon:yes stop_codon:yes gene_type:complete
MNKIANFLKASNIFFILIFLSSCNGEFNFNKRNKINDPIINSQRSNTEDKLEITISCNEESIEEYLKDGWKIKIRYLNKRFVHGNLYQLIILAILKKIKDAKSLNPIVLGLKQFIY